VIFQRPTRKRRASVAAGHVGMPPLRQAEPSLDSPRYCYALASMYASALCSLSGLISAKLDDERAHEEEEVAGEWVLELSGFTTLTSHSGSNQHREA
jgi:hypothetical protein